MIKQRIRKWLQDLLGYERYLFCFALLQVYRARLWGGGDFMLFSSQLPPTGMILDIGANLGITAVLLARAHPGASIYAFEPIPENAVTIERVCRYFKLGNVQIRQVALGDRNGMTAMRIPKQAHAWMQGLAHVIHPGEELQPVDQTVQAAMQRLDDLDLPLANGVHITGIKIDVENYEWYVLQGGKQVIEKYRPLIFCELWNDERKAQCIGLLQQLGYGVYVMERGKWIHYKEQDCLNYLFRPE